jgi:hypothetical protein
MVHLAFIPCASHHRTIHSSDDDLPPNAGTRESATEKRGKEGSEEGEKKRHEKRSQVGMTKINDRENRINLSRGSVGGY